MKALPVYLSPLAEWRIERILDYLMAEWGEAARAKFLKRLKEGITLISRYPGSAPVSESMPTVHRLVVTKQTSLYYRVTADAVEVITVIDNRQDPDAIAAEIRRLFEL